MSDEEIKRLRELCAKATPLPWRALTYEESAVIGRISPVPEDGIVIERPPQSRAEAMEVFFHGVVIGHMSPEDAEFIAAARSAVPALLDLVETLRGKTP